MVNIDQSALTKVLLKTKIIIISELIKLSYLERYHRLFKGVVVDPRVIGR